MTSQPKRKRLTKLKIGAIHFVDEGDNDPALVTFLKRRPGAAGATMPKTAEEIMAGLPEEDRAALQAHIAAMSAKPAAKAPNPNEEMIAKAMDAMGDHPKADMVKAAIAKALEDEDAAKPTEKAADGEGEGKPVEKDAAPSPDALPTDTAEGAANTGTAVDVAKARDFEKQRADRLARENLELRRERRIEKARSRVREEFSGIPKLDADDMANVLILSEDNLPEDVHAKLVDSFKATSALIRKSRLFVEDGSGDGDASPLGNIEQAALSIQAEETKAGRTVTIEKAKLMAVERSPEMYEEYRASLRH